MAAEGRSLHPPPAGLPGRVHFSIPSRSGAQVHVLTHTCAHPHLRCWLSPKHTHTHTHAVRIIPPGVAVKTLLWTAIAPHQARGAGLVRADSTEAQSSMFSEGTRAYAPICFRGFLAHRNLQKTPSTHLLQALTMDVEMA